MKKEVVDVLVHRLHVDPLPIAPPVADVVVSEQDDVVGLVLLERASKPN